MERPQIAKRTLVSATQKWIAGMAFLVGLLIFAWGWYLETRNPRSPAEDDFAWLVLGIGVSLGSFGVALWFLRLDHAFIVAILAPPVACVVSVVIFWTWLGIYGQSLKHHQKFAANGVTQIAPAKQMDELFEDCRHYITYGTNGEPLFNSVAYFGDRYELTMQIPVKIETEFSGSVVGEPKFYLDEVEKVSISSGQVGASFSRNLNFGVAEWNRVYEARGDFSQIGFEIDPTAVPNFWRYAAAGRPSN